MKYLLVICFLCSNLLYSQKSTIETIGDVNLVVLPVAAGVTTLILKDKEGTKQFMKSFVLNASITYALKHTINKKRPNGENYSFPSGHSSTTFNSAAFIQRRYGWKYGIPAYALATFTGYSRVYAKKHYTIDVVAGALIGIGSTYLFTTPYQKEHMELTLDTTSENDFLVGFKYRF